MEIRNYKSTDCAEIAKLFYETVHTVNARDYTKAQLNAWADGKIDITAWDRSFLINYTLVAEKDKIIIGFGDMDEKGYLDRLYVHKDYQGKGIATALVKELEKQLAMCGISLFTTHASITAKPFFEKQGYIVIKENTVVRNDIEFTNYIMEKVL